MFKRIISAVAVAAVSSQFAICAQAQSFPSKPVRIVIGSAPGGPTDNLTRGMSPFLSRAFGQPFVTENRDGANGIVAAGAVAKSAPDGHALLLIAAFTMTMNQYLYKDVPYDAERDFAPIAHVGGLNAAVIVHPSVAAKTWPELVALARQKPDSVSWASVGTTSGAALYRDWMARSMGIPFYNVPYKNYVQAFTAVMAGDVNVAIFAMGGVIPQAKAGKVRALAVIDADRSDYMPELPSFKELGFDAFFPTWFALLAPAGTPAEVVRRLNSEAAQVLRDSQFQEKVFKAQGFERHHPAGAPVEVVAKYLKDEREMYGRVSRTLGMKPQ